MKTLNWHHRLTMVVALVSVPVLTGIPLMACGGTKVAGGGEELSSDDRGACVVGGCSSQLCIEPGNDGVSTCEWREEYACYKDHGICERGANNKCGWRQTQALQDCITAANNPHATRTPVSGQCIRNFPDACSTDSDCTTGGCGGEVCHGVANPANSTCDCTAPQGISCGCLEGKCSWWQ